MPKRKQTGESTAQKKKARIEEEELASFGLGDPVKVFREHGEDDVKILCLNVNGIRASAKKGLAKYLKEVDADLVCFSEMKCFEKDNPLKKEFKDLGYNVYWNEAKKAGYAGTCILSKTEPLNVIKGVGASDNEGRAITLEFDKYCLVNTYVPNSGQNLKFKTRRQEWDEKMKAHLAELKSKGKGVIWTGDLNVAILDFDVYDGETNKQRKKTAGFTPYERESFRNLCSELEMKDVFREYYPEQKNVFTFFSYRGKSLKAKNNGWRLDYFVVTSDILPLVNKVEIQREQLLSDHVPTILSLQNPNQHI